MCCGMGAGVGGGAHYSEFSIKARQEWRREGEGETDSDRKRREEGGTRKRRGQEARKQSKSTEYKRHLTHKFRVNCSVYERTTLES